MNWTYSDWRSQGSAAARLARLRLHMQEVSDAIASAQSLAKDGASKSTHDYVGYLAELQREEHRLEMKADAAAVRPRLIRFVNRN